MNPDELRALADTLLPMAAAPCFDGIDVERAAAYLRAQAEPCIGNDSACPCQDGDACHYKDGADGTKAWSVPQAEPKREPLSDEQVTKGEYVLATKFGDGDPGDHWGVGFYDRFENGRHYVVDSAGKQIRGNGFRRVGRITVEVGRWLLSAAKSLEASPPGTVNLWTMLTGRAHRIGGTDPALDDLQAKERA